MARGEACTGDVLDKKRVELLVIRIHQHNGDALGHVLLEKLQWGFHGKEKNPIHSSTKSASPHRGGYLVGMIDSIQDEVAIELIQLRLDSFENLNKEECRKERDNGKDRVCAFAGEPTRIRMGMVVESVRNIQHSLPRLIRNTGMIVENP